MYEKVLTDSAPHVKKRDSTAVAHYREFLASEVHAQRARIFYLLDEMDSARVEMSAALATMRERDSTDMVILYQSKAMYLQSLGMIYERLQRIDLAREAYGQALQEDLSYYAAHSRLAQMTLAKGDTTGALSEMDIAVQLQPGDPVLRFRYADVLVHARRDGDAAAQLRKAIAIDPYYGAPHLLFARIADVEHYTDDAVAEYKSYIAVAARTDKQLLVAKARLAELTSTVASTPANP
jgi:tetratricopeptide (TPR) repeat protein